MHSQSPEPAAVMQRWGLAAPSTRGPRARLHLDDVVAAAVAVADESGYEAVTLAAVAARLGMTTTATYRYVDSKETLTELMVDDALGEPPTEPTTVDGWVEALWLRYDAHPWLAVFPLQRAPRCPNAFGWLSALADALRVAGDLTPLATALTVDVLVRGYATQQIAASSSGMSPALVEAVVTRYPQLFETPPEVTPRDALDAAIRRLLAG